jgi:Holin of 3TMs, for gene-transfer release
MPIDSKTPIASFGDTDPMPDTAPGAVPAGFGSAPASGFGAAAAAPSGFGAGAVTRSPAPQAAPAGYAPDRTAGAAAAVAGGAESTVANTNTDWINNKWRPAMGWLYMLTCFFDFVIFPILWSILQTLQGGQVTSQWQPLTLQGAGLYHIAMGAVLGIAAYGRTKEKLDQKQ